MKTKLIWITPDAEETVMYCARVSSPANQSSNNTKLLKYCINNKHWSIFEMANAVFEIETSRGITPQVLRHRSMNFQEYSLRYAESIGFETYRARRQDEKNRQNSIDDLSPEDIDWFFQAQKEVQEFTEQRYREALNRNICKEQARFLLPLSTTSRIYVNGTIRSWIHYLDLRSSHGTQKEHVDIALSIREQLSEHIPNIANALGWSQTDVDISTGILR